MSQSPTPRLGTGELPMTSALLRAVLGEIDEEATALTALDRAAELGLFPLVFGFLRPHFPRLEQTPGVMAQWRGHLARTALGYHELIRLNEALGGEIDYLVLKGQPLARSLYGNRTWRDAGDIDLLLRPSDLDTAIASLAQIGYFPRQDEVPRPAVNNQFTLYHEKSGQAIELHWSLSLPQLPAPSREELFRSSSLVHFDDALQLPTLSPEWLFLHLCYHFHHHCGFLKGLFDIAGWIDRFGQTADLEQIEQAAQAIGIMGMVQWPLHTLRALTSFLPPLYRERVRMPIRLWTHVSVSAAREALRSSRPFKGHEAPTFKTQNILKGHVIALMILAGQTLDHRRDRLRSGLYPIFLNPKAIAEARGKSTPDLASYLKVPLRPFTLVRKQVDDLLEECSR